MDCSPCFPSGVVSLDPPIAAQGDYAVSITNGSLELDCTVSLPLQDGSWSCTTPDGPASNAHVVFQPSESQADDLGSIGVAGYPQAVQVSIHRGGVELAQGKVQLSSATEGSGTCACNIRRGSLVTH